MKFKLLCEQMDDKDNPIFATWHEAPLPVSRETTIRNIEDAIENLSKLNGKDIFNYTGSTEELITTLKDTLTIIRNK